MRTYCRDKNYNMKKKRHKVYKTFTSILQSVDTVVITGATTTSVALSVAGVGLIVLLVSAGSIIR